MKMATKLQAAAKSLEKITLSHRHHHHRRRRRYHRNNLVADFPAGATVSAHKQIVMLRLGNPLEPANRAKMAPPSLPYLLYSEKSIWKINCL